MYMSKETTSFISLNFTEVILVVFIILKLCGIIDWSWWWVLCPLWIGLAIFLILLFGLLITSGLAGTIIILKRLFRW